MKNSERYFEALDYGKSEKAKLTEKQYLVYSYLMSKSKWDSQTKEHHYYVYKNSFLVKDACAYLNISQPTWRAAIKKLKENFYIMEEKNYYIIELPNSYAPLDIQLIRALILFGIKLEGGGIIVSLYSVLYKFWKYQTKNGEDCEITINQLFKLFMVERSSKNLNRFVFMLGLFSFLNLITIKPVDRVYKGNKYIAYQITDVKLTLPNDIDKETFLAPDDITNIIKALTERSEE